MLSAKDSRLTDAMRISSQTKRCAAVAALWPGLALSLFASEFYGNTTNDLRLRFSPGTVEVGDGVFLWGAPGPWLTNFSFEYWGTNTASPTDEAFAGPVEVRVRFYDSDGACHLGTRPPDDPYPGTLLFDTGWMAGLVPTRRATLNLAAGGILPPTGVYLPGYQIIWSVQFQGMGATDDVGTDVYYTDWSFDEYWERAPQSPHGWVAKTNASEIPMSFAAKLEGTDAGLNLYSPTRTAGGQFAFRIVGSAPLGFMLESSTNALDWSLLAPGPPVFGQFWFTNLSLAEFPQCFFRARIPPFQYSPSWIGPPFCPSIAPAVRVTPADAGVVEDNPTCGP
jgi:hypothetical protein